MWHALNYKYLIDVSFKLLMCVIILIETDLSKQINFLAT